MRSFVRRSVLGFSAGILLILSAGLDRADSAPSSQSVRRAERQLLSHHPGSRVRRGASGTTFVYGSPMTSGIDEKGAAASWFERYRLLLGGENSDLDWTWTQSLSDDRFAVVAYSQSVDGVPVESSGCRLLVWRDDGFRVVYAGARLIEVPETRFEGLRISEERASAVARGHSPGLTVWNEPRLVLATGRDWALVSEEPRLAFCITGSNEGVPRFESMTIWVDALDGKVLGVRDEVYRADIAGKVTAFATPDPGPDGVTNPPVEMPIAGARVRGQGSEAVYTDAFGAFTLIHSGTSPVTVGVDLRGEWVDVMTAQGTAVVQGESVTPPGPVCLVLNETPSEWRTAQVNGFVSVNRARDLYVSRLQGFSLLDARIACNVNLVSSCNAFFSPTNLSVNFFHAAGGCVNSAYSSVVCHEYGHFVVHQLGLPQGSFGEGYSDALAMLVLDDPVFGRDFFGAGMHSRDPLADRVQYPCPTEEIHSCGEILSGCWARINRNLQQTLGATVGLEVARKLFVDWSLLTVGGSGDHSAYPGTPIEVLVIDDDDGTFDTGTPHHDEICAAFAEHGIACPEIPGLDFDYPHGIPATLAPDRSSTFRLLIGDGAEGSPLPETAMLWVGVDGGAFEATALTETALGDYRIDLPAAGCGQRIEFYIEVVATSGETVFDPSAGAGEPYVRRGAMGLVRLFEDDFDQDRGWTVEDSGITAGSWERAIPSGDGSRGDPRSDFDGSGHCFVTEDGDGNTDVDGGPTRLISPAFDLSGTDGLVTFAAWFANDDADDLLTLEVSPTATAPWTEVKSYPVGVPGWFADRFVISDYVTPGAQTRVSFRVSDEPNNSVTEAAIDGFSLKLFSCRPSPLCLSQTPLTAGEETTFSVVGAAPGTVIGLVAGTAGIGEGSCFSLAGGLCLDLLGRQRELARLVSDASGEASITFRIPPFAPPITVFTQAVNRVGPRGKESIKSNVVVSTVLVD